jgi:hypothetical protein
MQGKRSVVRFRFPYPIDVIGVDEETVLAFHLEFICLRNSFSFSHHFFLSILK